MDELTIGDKIYISSKKSAQITGYAKDYIGQLCREGRVEARLVGRNWYVLESSIREHRFGKETGIEAPIQEPKAAPISTWSAPTYHSEPEPKILPPLDPQNRLQTSPVAVPALGDMQAAWKEWFDSREAAAGVTSTEPLTLEEDQSETPIDETVPMEEEGNEEEVETPQPSDITSNEAIFGGPVVHPAAYEEDDYHQIEVEAEEEISTPLGYDYEPAELRASPSIRARDVVDLTRIRTEAVREVASEATQRAPRRKQATRRTSSPNRIAQAALIGVAGVAVATSLIGSGLIDTLLGNGATEVRQEGPVIDLIQGERVINTK